MPLHRPIPLAAVIALPLLLSGSGIAAAQEPSTAASAPAAVVKPPTYAEALSVLAWDVNRRGPLIAPVTVTPRRVAPNGFAEALQEISPAELPPLADARRGAGYTPESVLARYDKASHRFGGVTAFGPAVQIEYQDHLPNRPDLNADGRRTDMTRHLLARLTAAQWQQITSKEGLDAAGLSAVQRALWEAIVPRPFSYERRKGYERVEGNDARITLSDAAREGVRIRVKWIGSAEGGSLERPGNWSIIVFKKDEGDGGLDHLVLANDDQYGPRATEFGAELVRRVPARTKPSQIDFTASGPLDAPVSLAPADPDKPLTVSELVARVAQASGLEWHVDSRIAKLPIVTRGDSARAGDVMAALAFGIAGAVRRLGPDAGGKYALLLTRDTEPLGAQQAHIDDWSAAARLLAGESNAAESRRIAAKNPLPLLRFDDDDPAALPPALLNRYLDGLLQPGARSAAAYGQDGIVVGLAELPPDLQKKVVTVSERLAKMTDSSQGEYNFRVTIDRVRAAAHPWISFVVPGVGEITSVPLDRTIDWVPKADETAPVTLAGKTLALRATTPAEAAQAVAAAKQCGATALWLEANPAVLTAAVKAGKAVQLPVAAVVRLLTVAVPGAAPDVNVFGEDGAAYARRRWQRTDAAVWYAPDDPAARAAALKRAREAAIVPGIAALVIRDAVPPGYRGTKGIGSPARSARGDAPALMDGAGAQLGYTLPHRLAFLRAKEIDPADTALAGGASYGEGSLYEKGSALFGVGGPFADDWAAWRYSLAVSLLTDTRATVRSAAPTLPIILSGRLLWRSPVWPSLSSSPWFATWPDTQKDAPEMFYNSGQTAPTAATVRLSPSAVKGTAPAAPSSATPGAKVWLGLVLQPQLSLP